MGNLKQIPPLFLADAEFSDFNGIVSIPVINGWEWSLSGSGTGYLKAPDGTEHCQFDLASASIRLEPGGDIVTAPGLTAPLVQEMGEKYAYEVVFSEGEKNAYDAASKTRVAEKKAYSKTVYDLLKGAVQLERKNGTWLAHVDTDKVMGLAGIESAHVLSRTQGITLFNQMAEKLHAYPLRDPSGYMSLKGNLYEFIHKEYQNQYENTLQAIDNQMIDATGYGVEAVLNHLEATVRKNISQDCLPKGEKYGDLRFVPATDECKTAVKEFVKQRVSKTLTYEKKRSYEKATIERMNQKYIEAGNRIKELLSDKMAAPALEA